jgi:transcriptional regulator with XRE-family HTH domain
MEDSRVPANDCPTAPATRFTVYTKVLHRACQIAGGVEKLAARLRVPVATLYRWLEGEAEPPTAVFLKAVDLVLPAWTPEDEALAQAIAVRRPRRPAE